MLNKILFSKVENKYLNYIRVIFGFLLLKNTLSEFQQNLPSHIEKNVDLYYPGFYWAIKLFGSNFLVFYAMKLILTLLVIGGHQIRAALALLCFISTYLFLNDPTGWLNHYYLINLTIFLAAFFPFKEAREDSDGYSYSWTVNSLKLMILIVYFFGGLSKINSDWLHGYPLHLWINKKGLLLILNKLSFDFGEKAAIFFSWISMAIDLLAPIGLTNKKTRKYYIFSLVVFHILNGIQFNIGIFPDLAIAYTCLFLIPIIANNDEVELVKKYDKKLIVIGIFFAIQAVIPLKRYLYPYDSLWTGESSRFSWRMIGSDKVGEITFFSRDKKTNEMKIHKIYENETPGDFLSFPNHIIQRAKVIKAIEFFKYGRDVSVHAEAYLSYNGRKAQEFIDPAIDLSEKEIQVFGRFDWILPLKVKLTEQKK